MIIRRAWILAAFSVAMASQASLAGGGDERAGSQSVTLKGQCEYRRGAEQVGPGTGFAACRSVVITRNGSDSVIDFRRSLGGSEFRYEGTLSGDTMTIESLQIRGRAAQAASGECTIFHRGDGISTVTCIAKVGWKTYAANFVPSRINPR